VQPADALPEILLALAALAALLFACFAPVRLQWLGAPIALAGLLAAALALAAQLGQPARPAFGGTWALDGAGIWARLLVVVATALATLLVPDWLRRDRRHGEYYALLLFSALGAMLMAGAADLLELVVGILLSSVTGYTLAAYHRDWALSVEAGMKYFLVGALANTLLLVGATLLFGLLGHTGYAAMASALAGLPPSPLLSLGLALFVVGIAFKLGAVPAHAWLPDVAEGAPAPSAAFLTVVPKLGAAIALARLLRVFPTTTVDWPVLVAVLSVATMSLGNLAALWQDDVRRLLGWSSVSQSGYALMAVVVVGRSPQAVPALLFFLAGYAAGNLAAFAVVTQLRGRTRLADYRGLGRQRPFLAATLVLALLSLVGIPPLSGFVGKLMLFLATIDAGYAWLAVVALANTAVSLFYYLRVIGPMYLDDAPAAPVAILGGWAGAGAIGGAVTVAALGLAAQVLLGQPDLALLGG
jgi:NADH-quinone oxidoreductase subunit N